MNTIHSYCTKPFLVTEDELVDYVSKCDLEKISMFEIIFIFSGNCKNIHTLLKNKHLRDLLYYINNCKKPDKALDMAMLEPIFVEFSDECLKSLGSF